MKDGFQHRGRAPRTPENVLRNEQELFASLRDVVLSVRNVTQQGKEANLDGCDNGDYDKSHANSGFLEEFSEGNHTGCERDAGQLLKERPAPSLGLLCERMECSTVTTGQKIIA